MERKDWLSWRKRGVGGSDAPIIVGKSRYKTRLQLHHEKVSDGISDKEPSYAAQQGIDAEPKIRALFELQMGESFEPALVQSSTTPWLLASLDGRTEDHETIAEFKLMNEADWQASKSTGKVPEQYWPQVQHCLVASGAKACWFVAYRFGAYKANPQELLIDNLVMIKVEPDLEYIAFLLKEEAQFWDGVERQKPPVPEGKDFVEVDNRGAHVLVAQILEVDEEIARLERHKAEAREKLMEIVEKLNHPKLRIGRMKIVQQSRQGSIDYGKVPELKNVNLDQYRKPGTTFWKMEVAK